LAHNNRLPKRSIPAHALPQHHTDSRQSEQQAHLHAQAETVRQRTRRPQPSLIAEDRKEEEENGETVIEQPQHEDRMQPLAQDEQWEDVRRHFRLPVALHDQCQR